MKIKFSFTKKKVIIPQLITSDVDSTLVTQSCNKFSEELISAIKKIKDIGGQFVLCSGRPTYSLISIAQEVNKEAGEPIIQYVSGFNGAQIYDVLAEQYILEDLIPASEVARINDFIISRGSDVLNYHQGQLFSNNPDNQYGEHESIISQTEIKPLREIYSAPKVLGLVEPEKMDQLIADMKEHFPEYSVCKSTPFFMEVNSKHIDKSNTLKVLEKQLGINHAATMAFGDNLNDYEMIKYAHTGVCVANAVEPLKEIADHVCGGVDENGVAKYLNEEVLSVL